MAILLPGVGLAASDLGSRGSAAPAFTLPGRGGTVSLESLRGHLVYVDFWASWCGPCQLSFPWMREMSERYGKDGLVIVAIDLDKSRTTADEFLSRHPSPFLVAFDPAGKTAEAFGVSAMPSSYLISPSGSVLHSISGFNDDERHQAEALIQGSLRP